MSWLKEPMKERKQKKESRVGSAHRIFDHIHMNVYWCIYNKNNKKQTKDIHRIHAKHVGADKLPCDRIDKILLLVKVPTKCCFGLRSDHLTVFFSYFYFSTGNGNECQRFHLFLFFTDFSNFFFV